MTDLEEILNTDKVYFNLSVSELVGAALKREEGKISASGALSVRTGIYTGRSPKDKFIVDEPEIHRRVHWGKVNRPISSEKFESLYARVKEYLKGRELFVFDGFAGADPSYRLPIRVINEYAWQNLFAHQMFIRPIEEELTTHKPGFTVISVPELKADPKTDGTNSEAFIICSFTERVILIGGTHYAGEIKKSVFSVLNYLLPQKDVFPMHCSANTDKKGHVALFFGLSGTGKTTLSADPQRSLIGDDEHGWSKEGVFNFEGGCYAKCLGLTEEKEPQIWNAIRHGSVLENVVLNPETLVPDYTDSIYTENTRAAYPLDYIPGASLSGVAGHPKVIVFLTADAFGVLPPFAKLTKEQAMYHFLSGYTSKLAGTERGVVEPEATFSACFGAPFLPLAPAVYAEMLGAKISEFSTNVYLVNTGWSGGPYGVGKRINLEYTRAMITAALNGTVEQGNYTVDPIFGILVPEQIEGVPDFILHQRKTWESKDEYDKMALDLARRFVRNFEQFEHVSAEIKEAGPKVRE